MACGGLALLFVLSIFKPVPIVTEDRAITETGIVSSIYEAGIKDVVFRVENTTRRFYINRGLENGLDLKELQNKLIGKEVVFKYPKYWTPLDWNNTVRHVSKVEINDEVIFNEFLDKE